MVKSNVYFGMDRVTYPKRSDISADPSIPIVLRNTLRGVKMKQIDISTKTFPNTFALVDDEDFEWLNQWKWHLLTRKKPFYASRKVGNQRILMHREILQTPDGALSDHRDGNGLNNQRYNLRTCTNSENQANRKLDKNNTSGFKGVSWHKQHKKWQANIRFDGKVRFLGLFFCIVKAARAYDEAAIKYFGEYANTNFKEKRCEIKIT